MKITNFRLTEVIGKNAIDYKFRALVDVETGCLWFKKKEKREIFKHYIGYWHYTETGEMACSNVDNLCRAFVAKNGKELENIEI